MCIHIADNEQQDKETEDVEPRATSHIGAYRTRGLFHLCL